MEFCTVIEANHKKVYNYKCEHGTQKYTCKPCGGSGICEHDRYKSSCKECGGSGFCEHGRPKSRCKECGGSGL